MGEELIPIVNEQDEIVGHKARSAIGSDDIYRVSALWLRNSAGEVLLAQRAFTKSHAPGLWGPAVAGTVDEGEDYLTNIIKETEEEIGLTDVALSAGPKVRRGDGGMRNYFVQWYFAVVDKPAEEFVLEDAVEAVRWYAVDDLRHAIAETPEMFLPNLPSYFELFEG